MGEIPERIHFFNNTITKDMFKSYVRHFLSRRNTARPSFTYTSDPAILAYTLMNEPRGSGERFSGVSECWKTISASM